MAQGVGLHQQAALLFQNPPHERLAGSKSACQAYAQHIVPPVYQPPPKAGGRAPHSPNPVF